MTENQKLREALQEAATSLETISRLAGRGTYPNGDDTYMGTFMEVRGYATIRAGVARQALATTEPVMANGLTEAETDATASVMGLATTEPEPTGMPELPEPDEMGDRWLSSHVYTTNQTRAYGEQCWKAGYKHGAWGDKPAVNQQLTTDPLDEREAFTDDTKDAERYRWLRDDTDSDWAICEWSHAPGDEGYYRDARAPHIVDAAIDAAMAQGVK